MTQGKKRGQMLCAAVFVAVLLSYSAANFYNVKEKLFLAAGKFTWAEASDGISSLETIMNEGIPGRYPLIEAYGVLQMLQGKHEINTFDLVKDREGYLHSGNFWSGFGDDVQELALRVRRLQDVLNEKNTQLGFVLMPMKTLREGAEYTGIPYNDWSAQADDMLRWLRYYGVPVMDMRAVLAGSGLTYEETYFRTDHHWSPRAAFYGFCKMTEWMNRQWEAGLDPEGICRDLSNYETRMFRGLMLGSQGRDAGYVYSGGLEDYEVIFPREEGSYFRVYAHKDEELWEKKGSFTETLLDLESRGDIYSGAAGRMYLGEISSYEHIENLDKPDGPCILMLRDSFSSPVGAFLIQACSQLDMLWTQAYESGEIEAFLRENQYDYVIVAIYPENLSFFNFPYYESEETK